MAAPPRSGPVPSHTLRKKRRPTTFSRPPRTRWRRRPALGHVTGRVAVDEREVLDGEPGMVLVLAMRGGVHLGLVAGVHVEDAALATAAQRDLAAAIEHDLRPGVVADLGGGGRRDGDQVGAAVEGDDPAGRHRVDHCARGAAGGAAVADDPVRVRRVDGLPRRAPRRHLGVAGRDAGSAGLSLCTAPRLRSGGKVDGGSAGAGGVVVGSSSAGELVLVWPGTPRLSSGDDPHATTPSVTAPSRIAHAPQRRCMGRDRSPQPAPRAGPPGAGPCLPDRGAYADMSVNSRGRFIQRDRVGLGQ